ncbi:hypothetical protein ACFQ7F_32770 [Streptomyces sp. NPDC056486]|uniref:hypothetical protein n=1 Tax=Streptomyces sp. NPDC056486 TaxID=3345835 RepID=UPI0036C1B5D6
MSVPPQPRQSPDAQSQSQNQKQSQKQSQNGSQKPQSPWAATGKTQGERVTNRLRRVAEELPDWEPLPPGETFVRRPGSSA